MKTTHRRGVAISAAILAIFTASAAQGGGQPWIKVGISGEEAMLAIAGQCASVQQGPPSITCIQGPFGIYASVSAKNRVYYVKQYEPLAIRPEEYAAQTARELGFAGEGAPCKLYNDRARCWESDDGTKLFTGMLSTDGILSTVMINERIKKEDDEP